MKDWKLYTGFLLLGFALGNVFQIWIRSLLEALQ